MNNEYVEVYSLGSGGLVKKLATVDNKEIPDVYFGFKSTTSSEILYVSFDIVPYDTNDVFVVSNITSEHNITNSCLIKKLLREGETSNFIRISDSSFSINITGIGTVIYERIQNTKFLYQSEVPVEEANKQVTINQWDYTDPIEITPSIGNDVIDKATVTLSGYVTKLYCWKNSQNQYAYSLIDSPDCGFAFQGINVSNRTIEIRLVTRSGDGIIQPPYTSVYSRYSDGDIVFREVDQAADRPSWWSNEGILPNKMAICVNIEEADGYSITGNGTDTIQTLLDNAGKGDDDIEDFEIIYHDATSRYYCNKN